MRTLLNESLPPRAADEQILSPSESATPALRTFSQNAVLSNLDNLVEVGLGGTVIATPSARAEQTQPALERGMTLSETLAGSEPARPASAEESTPTV
jgi:hypothetical protein